MPQWAIQGAMIGGSALAGALNNRSKTSTNQWSKNRQFSDDQKTTEARLHILANEMMMDPAKGLDPIRRQAMQRVDTQYRAMPQDMMDRFASRGMLGSGKLPLSMAQMDLARAGEMASLENDFANLILQRQQQGASLGERLLGVVHGEYGTGQQTQPGNQVGGAVSGGMETLSSMLMMNKLLNGEWGF